MVFASLLEQGRVGQKSGLYAEALATLGQAMDLAVAEAREGDHDRALVHLEMAHALAGLGRWREAYDHQRSYLGIEQSLEDSALRRQLQEQRARFDAERMEAENALLARERELADLRTAREAGHRRIWVWSTATAIAVAALLALGLWRDRNARKRLEQLASTDDLTGMPNRRTVFAAASEEFDRARRYGFPLTLAMLDLDGFKAVNDVYGHAAGDEILVAIAAVLKSEVRSPDRVGRVGGEEFLVLFPHTDSHGAAAVAARLCEGLRGQCFPVLRGERNMTLSVGVAQVSPSDGDLDATLRRADVALYEAKRTGRDRFVILEAPEPAADLAGAASPAEPA
jgi:diguanylate cyclase (GGDEF)-like protein